MASLPKAAPPSREPWLCSALRIARSPAKLKNLTLRSQSSGRRRLRDGRCLEVDPSTLVPPMQRALRDLITRIPRESLARQRQASGGPGALWEEAGRAGSDLERWRLLLAQGVRINPCNSRLHPAARAGLVPDGEDELSVQDAYTPDGHCFGCGPSAEGGLYMQSFRSKNGLEAYVTFPSKYTAFPGILNGGLVGTAFECGGNWTAAVALMDRSSLPKPPMTLTAELLVQHRRPSPPDVELLLRSHILDIRGGPSAGYPGTGDKVAVEVEMNLMLPEGGRTNLLSSARGIFKRVAAVRAM